MGPKEGLSFLRREEKRWGLEQINCIQKKRSLTVTQKKWNEQTPPGKDLEGGGLNWGNAEAAWWEGKMGFGNKECRPPPTPLFREPPLEKATASGGFLRFCHMLYKGNHFLGLPTKFSVRLPPSRSSLAKPEACCNLVTIIKRVRAVRHNQVCPLVN